MIEPVRPTRRAWHEASRTYRTARFGIPAGATTLAASGASAILSTDAPTAVIVGVALVSGGGGAVLVGFVVWLSLWMSGPVRWQVEDQLRAKVQDLSADRRPAGRQLEDLLEEGHRLTAGFANDLDHWSDVHAWQVADEYAVRARALVMREWPVEAAAILDEGYDPMPPSIKHIADRPPGGQKEVTAWGHEQFVKALGRLEAELRRQGKLQ